MPRSYRPSWNLAKIQYPLGEKKKNIPIEKPKSDPRAGIAQLPKRILANDYTKIVSTVAPFVDVFFRNNPRSYHATLLAATREVEPTKG